MRSLGWWRFSLVLRSFIYRPKVISNGYIYSPQRPNISTQISSLLTLYTRIELLNNFLDFITSQTNDANNESPPLEDLSGVGLFMSLLLTGQIWSVRQHESEQRHPRGVKVSFPKPIFPSPILINIMSAFRSGFKISQKCCKVRSTKQAAQKQNRRRLGQSQYTGP